MFAANLPENHVAMVQVAKSVSCRTLPHRDETPPYFACDMNYDKIVLFGDSLTEFSFNSSLGFGYGLQLANGTYD